MQEPSPVIKQPPLRNQSVEKREQYGTHERFSLQRECQTDRLRILSRKIRLLITEAIFTTVFSQSACKDAFSVYFCLSHFSLFILHSSLLRCCQFIVKQVEELVYLIHPQGCLPLFQIANKT